MTCNLVSEQLLKDTVDTIIALGLRDLGYKYFNLDDCWASGRQPNGEHGMMVVVAHGTLMQPHSQAVTLARATIFNRHSDRRSQAVSLRYIEAAG